jgi:AcrR family transcriptional regulator
MPKAINHEARRHVIAEAVWRVISRDGVAAASVRAVAAEAGLSVGSLRHIFPSHSDLLVYAMHLVVERIESRIAHTASAPAINPRTTVEGRLLQLLPLDDERRVENEVWLAFSAQALVTRELRDVWSDVHRTQHHACKAAVEALGVDDTAFEARRLHALIDGLAVHAALSPYDAAPERLVATVRQHLNVVETRTGHESPAS